MDTVFSSKTLGLLGQFFYTCKLQANIWGIGKMVYENADCTVKRKALGCGLARHL